MGLTDREKTYLLSLARDTIGQAVTGGKGPVCEEITPVLAGKRGAFVTLRKHGELRGCIGYIVALRPLVETVREMAVSAAFHDPRFSPVKAGELSDIDIEISVLSPVCRLDDPMKVEVGLDGLIVRRDRRQGLLLPQVAVEHGWDRETFLAQTCRKAGLPPDAWKLDGTEIDVFRAEVFGEKEYPNIM